MLSNKAKIVLVAVLFNLLFEFAVRGVPGILHTPGFVLILFFIYFSYFWVVEELIFRYRVTNRQLMVIAFVFGLIPMTFLTGALFAPPLTAGINIGRMLFINIVWWGILQGLLTFYFATRLVPRDWNRKPGGKPGWILPMGYILFISGAAFRHSPILPRGQEEAYALVILIIVIGIAYLALALRQPRQAPYKHRSSALLSLLSVSTIVVFLFSGFVVARTPQLIEGSYINPQATQVAVVWTVVVATGVLFYYIKNRKPITI